MGSCDLEFTVSRAVLFYEAASAVPRQNFSTQNRQTVIFLLFSVDNAQTKGANILCRPRFQGITSGCKPSESISTPFLLLRKEWKTDSLVLSVLDSHI